MDQIGIVGGVIGFYASIAMFVIRHFAEIDYFTTAIKSMYFEEQSDRKFFAKYVHGHDDEVNNGTRTKPNFC